jgi:hypothetical protein
MRNLLIVLLILLQPGCRKDSQTRPPISERKDFFSNESDALRKVNTFLDKYPGMPKADALENISYIDSKTKSYAFVFYRSKRGIENIVIEQEYSGTMISQVKSIKCDGEDCDCKVITIISDEGDVSVDCTCHSCDMIIRQ